MMPSRHARDAVKMGAQVKASGITRSGDSLLRLPPCFVSGT
jgi:hypothetical protein